MPDIYHDLSIKAALAAVFETVTTPEGLNTWWTKRASGEPGAGKEYQFWFAPEYDRRSPLYSSNSDRMAVYRGR